MTAPSRLRLILWNGAEARERAAALASQGWAVDSSLPDGPALLRELRGAPPDAIVIDLGRLPSHGRDVALSLRNTVATRTIPLVFVSGDPVKTEAVRALLPDAVFTTWKGIRGALRRATRNPPARPVVPSSVFAGYSGTPLPRKLGIKPGMTVALFGAPDGFPDTLGTLPEGATLRSGLRGAPGLILWFVRREKELAAGIQRMARAAAEGPIWIAWPKKSARAPDSPGPSEKSVRAAGLAAGLVDYKVCAIDATWSGLLFRRRKPEA